MARNKATADAAVYVHPDALEPDPQNPRRNDDAVPQVADSIRRFGFGAPIVARRTGPGRGVIIAGHTRWKAARSLGLDRVPVRFMDLSEAEARALMLADNRLGEIAEWDEDALRKVIDELGSQHVDMSGLGWAADELAALAASSSSGSWLKAGSGPAASDNDVPDSLDGDADSEVGRVYHLGPHILVCGDSTKPASWDQLGDISSACVITSPPYGVGENSKLRDRYVPDAPARKSLYLSHDDDPDEWLDLMHAWTSEAVRRSGGVFCNVQMLARNKRDLVAWMHRWVGHLVDVLVWDKGHGAPQMQRGVVNNAHEWIVVLSPIDNASRAIPFANFHGTVQSIVRVGRGSNEYADDHRAVFPVDLPASMIDIASMCEVVVDPFAGTGTTLIAAARSGRVARLIEKEPKYCDIIRRRWTKWAIENGQDPGPGRLD